ncbi:MAG: extracellular solute-binding protein [Clostridiales bacterium]|nr:extracellular solute-binding protein [Clostridiales bacterium]MDR2749897.1 extracellular solute-binding protein [Clostridiales bacterium]
MCLLALCCALVILPAQLGSASEPVPTQSASTQESLRQVYLSLDGRPEDTYEAYLQSHVGPIFNSEINFLSDFALLDDMDGASKDIVVEAPENAWYAVRFAYTPSGNGLLPTTLSLAVDGEFPCEDLETILADNIWLYGGFQLDRYGNECAGMPSRGNTPSESYVKGASGLYGDPMLIYLEKGQHVLTFTCQQGEVLIGGVTLSGLPGVLETVNSPAPGQNLIVIEAERISRSNTPNIRSAAEYNSSVSPYSAGARLQNIIDDDSFKNGSASVEYDIVAPAGGYYNVSFYYRQGDKPDFPVFRRFYVDGALASDVGGLRFDYSRSFATVGAGQIYLGEGSHKLKLEVALDNVRYAVMAAQQVAGEIDELALELSKITGGNTDYFRDFRLGDFGIDAEPLLLGWADTIRDLGFALGGLTPGVSNPGETAPLGLAEKMLRILAEKPDELPKRLNEFCYGPSSVRQYLVSFIGSIQFSQLGLDKIAIYQDSAELPEKAGVAKRISQGVQRFANSFRLSDYTAGSGGEALKVWVCRPRQYLEIMQAMADTGFTEKTGILVDLSLVPDQQKLILANASGKAPDAVIAMASNNVYDLAVRGALADMRGFGTFKEAAKRFAPGMLIPGVCDEGMYALPETFNFWVMYYRQDILDQLGLSVPDTMDEVRAMLPQLRRRGMNFNSQVSNFTNKPYAAFAPFVYQSGGDLFSSSANGGLAHGLDLPGTIEGLEVLTENYTIYSMDFEIQNFYQYFRDGRTPIGISDYGTFNLLTNAAPELAGKWSVAPYPGVAGEDGTVSRYTSGAAESCAIFQSGRQDDAWAFIDWWLSTEVQTEFAFRLQSTLGNEYQWNPANLEAMAAAPWNRAIREVILSQLEWTWEPPRVPGGYMIEREVSNAINTVALDGRSLRSALDDAGKQVAREFRRKLEEFGYAKDGEQVKPFVVPDIDLMKEWLQ